MSRVVEREIPCPRCGKQQTFRFYEVINVREDPDMKQLAQDGSVFDLHCSECGQVSRIGYPLLYHDPDRRLMIFMTAPEHRQEAFQAMHALRSAGVTGMADMGRYSFRAVTQPPALCEKIILWDEQMDDRFVEIAKLYVAIGIEKKMGKTPSSVFVARLDEPTFLIFPDDQSMPMAAPLSRELYDQIRKDFQAFLPTDPDSCLFVDRDWAAAQLQPAKVLQ